MTSRSRWLGIIVFFTFGWRLPRVRTRRSTRRFKSEACAFEQFKQHLKKRNIEFTDKDFADNKDYLKRAIRFEIVYDRLGNTEAAKVALDGDPQVDKAIELMPQAKELANKARAAMTAGRD